MVFVNIMSMMREKPMEESKPKVEEKKEAVVESKYDFIDENKNTIYYAIRFVQVICIGVAVFGSLWQGTETFNMTTPQFMMLYGSCGAVISEVTARLFKKKISK